MNTTTIKERLAKGETVYGPFIKADSAALVEILGHTGFDYVLLDMEHSPVPIGRLEDLMRAAQTAGIVPIVRVSAIAEPYILQPLDKGAAGLLVPMVDTVDMARQVVRMAKYAPLGSRGMDIYARSARFGAIPKTRYFEEANRTGLLAVQIEGPVGMQNAAAIAAVEAIDVVYIGPYDLSQSLGIPGQVDDPRVVEKIKQIVDAVASQGKCVGIYVDDAATARKYQDMGVRFITVCVDTTLFFRACTALRAELG